MSIAASHRPDPDQLAAFIDGRLSGEERRSLEVHLGACEACREVVAESLSLLEEVPEAAAADGREDEAADAEPEGGKVLTHPGWRRAAWGLAPLAAAALLVLVIWPSGGPATSRDLIAGYTDPRSLGARLPEGWTEQGWPTFRSGESYLELLSEEQVAFRLGVRAVDLRVALVAEAEASSTILSEMILLVEKGLELAMEPAYRYRRIRDSIETVPGEETLEAAWQAEETLAEYLRASPSAAEYFGLGKWTEAGRLAAIAGDEEFFENRTFRRDGRRLERAGLNSEVKETIRRIPEIAEGPLDEGSLEELRETFAEIIRSAG